MATINKHFNVTSDITQELVAPGNNARVSAISLANVHKLKNVSVDLYIEKKLTGTFYFFKKLLLPPNASLIHDLSFDNGAGEFGLYIKLTKDDTFTLTGSIDPAASVTVPGVGTLFLTETTIGDEIVVSGETRTVSAIASNTSLTVSSAFSNNSNDTSPDCNPAALVDVIIM